MLNSIITIIIIVTSILLVASVLLQNRGSGTSGVFGGDSESYYSRRGFDKILFSTTIILSIIFVGSVLAKSIIG
jgi:preprotein translocase subunit SecG